ncbi:MAG: putative transport system permease protein [Gemmatimonadales bacterium]|nr:putative transport system permease protein [Gemmatimonadales bacterium]
MTGPAFVFRMAARELRAAPKRLLLLMGTVAVGVAALVAINSFTDNLQDSVRQQARALLGADLAVVSRQAFSPRVEALLDTLSRGARLSRMTSFAGMAYVPRTAGSRLVQVAALEGQFPYYGEIRTEPQSAWSQLQSGRHVVVDPSLLTALSATIGDTIALGEGRFVITGTIESAPSDAGVRFAFGPRIYIPARYLEETGLLGFGARVEHEAFLELPASVSAQVLADRYRPGLRAERVRLRTVADDQRNLNDVLSKLTGYLGLVALIALLLGGIGVASAIVVFIRQRSQSVAVLRCLGATSGSIFAIYLLEAGVMGLVGSIAGALLGIGLQRLLPGLLSGLLPVDVTPSLSWNAAGLGIGMGLWVALVFALLPLLAVRRISPLSALRRPYESERTPRDRWAILALLLLAGSTVALAAHQTGSWRQGAIFAGAVGVVLLILYGAAWILIRGIRRWLPAGWPYVWRQGMANLHRPANQTVTLVLAIGFGAFLLGTLYLVQHNLLSQLRLTGGPARPNLVLFDIQPDQLTAVEGELQAAGLPRAPATPIVPMRIRSVKGRPVGELLVGTLGQEQEGPSSGWALRREYRSTYRDSVVASERVVAGRWSKAGESPTRISLEQGLAAELGVAVGDKIVWDVQGVPVPTQVGSLREVDWARFEPNFFVVFAPGALEAAPQSFVTLTRIPDAAARGRFQRRLAERFGNVSTLDLSLLQEALERLVERVALAIRFMALFSLGVGVLVLVGALATSRFQRVREGALLRTLGATRGQVFRVVLAEYLSLGLLAAVVALLLAAGAGWAIARFLFEGSFTLPVLQMAALTLALVTLTVIVGLANSRDVVRQPPLEVLRQDA